MPLACDISNYSSWFDAQGAQKLYDAGVRRAVVQLVNPSIGNHQSQLNALVKAGIEVEAYVYIWFGDDVATRIQWACDQLTTWPQVKRLWLDCEDPSVQNGSTAFSIKTVISACVQIVQSRGLEVGIYTGASWWKGATGDCQDFSNLPLWIADYAGQQNLSAGLCGGWAKAEMKQYAGNTTIASVSMVDLDWYEEDETITYETLTQSEDIEAVKAEVISSIGTDGGGFIGRITGGYTPRPGNKALIVEVKA